MTKARSKTSERLTRSQTMARVKSNDTAPEMLVRRALHAAGLRYRLHRADLPGRPDITLASRRTVIFVHGCFWHAHPGCGRARVPTTRQDYWIPKLQRNADRDRKSLAALEASGWQVEIVWECELRDPLRLPALVSTLKTRSLAAYPQAAQRPSTSTVA